MDLLQESIYGYYYSIWNDNDDDGKNNEEAIKTDDMRTNFTDFNR